MLLFIISSCSQSQKSKSEDVELELQTFISLLEYDFKVLEDEIKNLGNFVHYLFENKEKILSKADKNKYKFRGAFSNVSPNSDPNLSTIYISETSENKQEALELLYLTNSLDSAFRAIIDKHPVVSQVYFNSQLQINRLYPPYDAFSMLDPDLDVTSFNFYYFADEQHNPSKETIWVDETYVDPVGKGWMISLLNPIYFENDLKMVLAFDITLNDIIEAYLDKFDSNFVIIDSTGKLVAGKAKGIEALSLPPLKNHTYTQTITSDSYREEDFNLFSSKNREVRKLASQIILSSEDEYILRDSGVEIKVSAAKMSKLNWYVLDLTF
ncbi:Cache sensor protein [Shivajiella indica]|uniref:Cache sensor protein n=1 Tax=Shivajiella indica TaxID=872115 RepID=A0ABW5BB80_9BACT